MIRYLLFLLLISIIVSSPHLLNASIVADITPQKELKIPKGWELKEWNGRGNIQIENEGADYFIHLKSSNNSFALHKELEFNIKEFPIITWRWKVAALPEGGDVRNRKTDDQAAQVYVVFPKFPKMINSRIIGYIWETSAPAGTTTTSQKFSYTKYIVLQSGREKLGEWIEENRNVYADYKMLFNEEPPKVGKVSIMIDSDDTKSNAESYFSEIRFEKETTVFVKKTKDINEKEKKISLIQENKTVLEIKDKESIEVKKKAIKKAAELLKRPSPEYSSAVKEEIKETLPQSMTAVRSSVAPITYLYGIIFAIISSALIALVIFKKNKKYKRK